MLPWTVGGLFFTFPEKSLFLSGALLPPPGIKTKHYIFIYQVRNIQQYAYTRVYVPGMYVPGMILVHKELLKFVKQPLFSRKIWNIFLSLFEPFRAFSSTAFKNVHLDDINIYTAAVYGIAVRCGAYTIYLWYVYTWYEMWVKCIPYSGVSFWFSLYILNIIFVLTYILLIFSAVFRKINHCGTRWTFL